MRMKKSIFLALYCGLIQIIHAQNINEIVGINNTIWMGTPRFTATGGAFTALGNDFTGAHLNPAGLGVFRADEFGFTLGGSFNGVNSSFYGQSISGDQNNIVLPSIGYIEKIKTKDPDITWNWGITFNRNQNFNFNSTMDNQHPNSSILQEWMQNATGTGPTFLAENGWIEEELAWRTFLIDDLPENNYTTQAVMNNVNMFMNEMTKGRYDQLSLTFAREKDNKLYLGGSFNLDFYRQDINFFYQESFTQGDSIAALEYLDIIERRGIGFNFKMGAIYRPTDNLRLGASVFTPTWFRMRQEFDVEITGLYRRGGSLTANFIGEEYRYRLRNAPQANLGAAYVFDKNGFLSLDYTFMPTKWSGTGTSELDYLNKDISNFLRNQHSIRAGAEIRAISWFFRLGYHWLSNPYNFDLQNGSKRGPSFGIGYRTRSVTIDVAYALQRSTFNYYLFSPDLVDPIVQDLTGQTLLISLGFRM